jgi:hypothetical protein
MTYTPQTDSGSPAEVTVATFSSGVLVELAVILGPSVENW